MVFSKSYIPNPLPDFPDVLFKLQQNIHCILIDEFQDVNKLQYNLVKLIGGKNGNIFIVGDDDQSIYRFRGAGEENLRQFEKDFTNVSKVVLDTNYRCPKEIVAVSSKLILANEKRFYKNLSSGKKESGKVTCLDFINKDLEREFVTLKIEDMIKTVKEVANVNYVDKNEMINVWKEIMKQTIL